MNTRRRSGRTAVATGVRLALAAALGLAAAPAVLPAADVVALARTELPDVLQPSAALAEKIESAVTDSLRRSGFAVVPSREFETAWQARLEEAGGYFDIVTGEPDPTKRRALRASVLGGLLERHGARALLQPAVVVGDAPYAHGKAEWDGARETAAPSGSGDLPALSLVLRVEDLGAREIAAARAGIQLLAKYSVWNGRYAPVPREKLLADVEPLREAADRAVLVLLEALRAAPAAVETVEGPAGEEAVEAPALSLEPAPPGARIAALRALRLPAGEIAVSPEVRARYLEELRIGLEAAGWSTLPPEVFERTLRETVLERGGVYDPITGHGDAGRLAAAVEETRRRVAERHGASAFVSAGIYVRPARFAGESATWDGVSEPVTDIAAWKKLLVTTQGTTRALSVGLVAQDAQGTTLHVGWGGIQLVERFAGDRFVHVPSGELFRDPALDRRAVELCLAGWHAE